MRLCVVGNSHIAALKHACAEMSTDDLSGVKITFLGSHSTSLREVYCEDGRFRTHNPRVRRTLQMTSGRADPELAIDGFDGFLIYGLYNPNWVVPYTLRAFRHFKTNGVLSVGLLRAVVREILERSLMLHIVHLIRGATDAPVTISPQPFLSQQVLSSQEHGRVYAGIDSLHSYPGPTFESAFRDELSAVVKRESLSVLPQPIETIVEPCFTAHKFCVGSVRLTERMDEEHPEDDFQHMNRAYGALVMRDLIEHLSPKSAHGLHR